MDKERLIALHTLSVATAVGGLLTMCVHWLLVLAIMPLHVYFSFHGARAAGAGRLAAAGIGLVAAVPVVNTLVLLLVNNRLASAMLAAGVPREAFGFSRLRRA